MARSLGVVAVGVEQRCTLHRSAGQDRVRVVRCAKAVTIGVDVPGHIVLHLVDQSVAVVVDVVAELGLPFSLGDAVVFRVVVAVTAAALRALVVSVAAHLVDGAVAVVVLVANGQRVAVVVYSVTDLHVARVACGVVVVAVVAEWLAKRIDARSVVVTIVVVVWPEVLALPSGLAAEVRGAFDVVIAVHRCAGNASFAVRVRVAGVARLLAVAEQAVVAGLGGGAGWRAAGAP